ncbi:MAG: hypothetical protein FJ284_10350 [Planctomycetes bacterium]|nr:hypothetical protein [Planctomycetota bacterium]MBM4057355.1 hypothetical protein [Planctomycetota bacterium]
MSAVRSEGYVVPPPRRHRHRYHGVFAANHRLRKGVTALAIGNIGKRRGPAAGAARPPTGASSSRSTTIATSSRRRPMSCP